MNLFVHNILSCRVKSCTSDMDTLKLVAEKWEDRVIDYKPDLMKKLIGRISFEGVRAAIEDNGWGKDIPLPETLPTLTEEASDELLRLMHHALLERVVINGKCICSKCGREYPIEDGICNVMLTPGEI
eukprot:gnl/Chilomastix_caulleri/4352.p1 GENE.gnl/Chilomastix_caulleri/4352~~gnl/Chilomastix_caulleri/4352.p1  ORF type:complete len:128 (+),score=13.54 gnl/Chilomastix_caulleri/4352:61-444(+)